MILKTYYAIRVNDINNDSKEEYNQLIWEILSIKAYNYYEAAMKLRQINVSGDYHLVTNHTLRCRDVIRII